MRSAFELVEQAALGAREKFSRIQNQKYSSLGLDVDHASYEPRNILGEVRRVLDGMCSRTQHFRDAVDDQARAMAARLNNDKPTPVALFQPRHIETLPLIDHGHDGAA